MNISIPKHLFDRYVPILPEDVCWPWKGSLESGGYGRFEPRDYDFRARAHRLMYQLTYGPIPDGFHIHHVCKMKSCVNPLHLLAVSPEDHARIEPADVGKSNREKTHCSSGHEYNVENTYINKKDGKRYCRECVRIRQRSNYHAVHIANSAKTHCPAGHEYNERNTRIKNGHRHCRVCHNERSRALRLQQKQSGYAR